MRKIQVLVVGAGPGGYVAAIKLGKLGKKVLVVDKDKLGGECLNYGCIPSKALIAAANLVYRARRGTEIGLNAGTISVDMAKIQIWRANLIGGFNKGIAALLKGNGVEVLQGEARFKGPHAAEVSAPTGAETIEFEQAIIAAGSRPIEIPGFKIDGRNVLSSRHALELQEVPKKLFVIGAGAVGLEIGIFYAKLGSKVVVVEMLDQILPGTDLELTRPVSRSLQKLGVEVYLGAKASGFAVKDGGLEVAWTTPEGEKKGLFDKILLSVGRRPNSDALGLETAGVKKDAKGYIPVNERYQTSAGHIYAIGDLIGPPFLAHKASREGILTAFAIAGEKTEQIGAVPWAIFTDPEIAFVGMTETQAKEQGIDVSFGRLPFSASGRAQTTREADGFVKVMIEKGSSKILGVGIVGPEASDLISEAALAIRLGATAQDVASTIHPHPTLPEAFMEACEAALGQSIHILAPARR